MTDIRLDYDAGSWGAEFNIECIEKNASRNDVAQIIRILDRIRESLCDIRERMI